MGPFLHLKVCLSLGDEQEGVERAKPERPDVGEVSAVSVATITRPFLPSPSCSPRGLELGSRKLPPRGERGLGGRGGPAVTSGGGYLLGPGGWPAGLWGRVKGRVFLKLLGKHI